jgi:hypothetical protein
MTIKFNIDIYIGLAPEYQYPVPVIECVGAYQYLVDTLNVTETHKHKIYDLFIIRFLVQKSFFLVIQQAEHFALRL